MAAFSTTGPSEGRLRRLRSIQEVDRDAWDALVGDDDPFVEHDFLSLLEESGSVGPGTGWLPQHLTLSEGERLVAALPLYLKGHSYGEYIFDWAWAGAASRLGIPYYPKLLSMVPLTPATGRRLLIADGVDPSWATGRLLDGCFELADSTSASSLHLHFVSEEERELLRQDGRLMPRTTLQYHWQNAGYRDFDDYLDRFRSPSRKQVRRERRRVAESGLEIRLVSGDALTMDDWRAIGGFYSSTCQMKLSHAYLTPRFFELAHRRIHRHARIVLALDGATRVAGSLCFHKGQHLYGRYWGSADDFEMLHFELCYYRPLEYAIAEGVTRFEAGAQGSHKLDRGLMPSPVHSFHWVRDEVLGPAVGEYLGHEAREIEARIVELSARGPFKRSGS